VLERKIQATPGHVGAVLADFIKQD